MSYVSTLRVILSNLDLALTDGDSIRNIKKEYGEETADTVRCARRLSKRGTSLQEMSAVILDLDNLLTDGDSISKLRNEGYGKEFVDNIRLARLAVRKLR